MLLQYCAPFAMVDAQRFAQMVHQMIHKSPPEQRQGMRHDFEALPENVDLILHPREANFLHREPIAAVRMGAWIVAAEAGQGFERGAHLYDLSEAPAFCEGWTLAAPETV